MEDGKLFIRYPRQPPFRRWNGQSAGFYRKHDFRVIFPDDENQYEYGGLSAVPNFPGIKYLVGPRKEGEKQEDNEHVIFCCGWYFEHSKCRAEPEIDFHFSISVEKTGCFWLHKPCSGTNSKETVSLNGVNLKKNRRLLKFGDKITVKNKDGDLHHFRFDMEEKLKPEEGPGQFFFPGYVHTGLVPIFYEVISYLPLPDLKSARLVSHLWEDEARKILLRKSVVPLPLSNRGDPCHNRMLLLRFAKELGSLVKGIVNLQIEHPYIEEVEEDDEDEETEEQTPDPAFTKFFQDFDRYFVNLEQFGDSVKFLSIQGEAISRNAPGRETLWKGCLEKFHNLEELCMIVNSDDGNSFPPLASLNFPRLRRFELGSNHHDIDGDEFQEDNEIPEMPGIRDWIKDCIAAIKGVKDLDMSSFFYSHIFLQEMMTDTSLPNLSTLFLEIRCGETLEILLSWGTNRQSSLTRLQLKLDIPKDVDVSEKWKSFCQTQASTLRRLCLDFKSMDVRLPTPRFQIRMPPVLSELEVLEIFQFSPNFEMTWDNVEPGDSIDYSTALPKLKMLTLIPVTTEYGNVWEVRYLWGTNRLVWTSFFGGDLSNRCETLRRLEIPHVSIEMWGEHNPERISQMLEPGYIVTDWRNEMLEYLFSIMDIIRLFPNLNNDWILNIKKIPYTVGNIVSEIQWRIPAI